MELIKKVFGSGLQQILRIMIKWFFILIFSLALVYEHVAAAEYPSPMNVIKSVDQKTVYVSETGSNEIAVVHVADGIVTNSIKLPESPLAMALSPDNGTILVTTNSPEGKVYCVDVEKGKIRHNIAVGHTPTAIAVSRDGKTGYVCNRFDNNIAVIDLKKRKERTTIPVTREPNAVLLTQDGKYLYVANHMPYGAANYKTMSARVDIINTSTNTVVKSVPLPNGSTGVRAMCLSPDGKYVYITHVLGRYLVPTTQLERGWMNTNAVTIIENASKKWLNTVLLDDVDLGAANPWGVQCTEDGKNLCVTLSGTHEVAVIDRVGMHEKLTKLHNGQHVSDVSLSPMDVQNDLSFLVGLKKRIKLEGKGPRGFTIIGSTLYIAEYFTNSLGIVNLDSDVKPAALSVALGPEMEMDVVRKGELYFHDGTRCFQHWQSCVSCHPDTRADGLNWDLLNDGMGNPKQAKSMILSHRTPPVMITGVRDNAEIAVRAGMKYIQFTVRPEEEAVAIDEYLKSLQPVQSPYLDKGKLSKAAKRGKKMFEKAGCLSCHSGPYFTDLQKYDLGMGEYMDQDVKFDVPTLREVWRTAPYLYDGRAVTIKEVLTIHNKEDKHGITSDLKPEEIKDLIEYILSL